MAQPHIRRERLAAHIAAHLTMKAISQPDGTEFRTYGEIVEETLRRVDQACDDGQLSIEIEAWERDPDD